MGRNESTDRPGWLSNDMYPFESRLFITEQGHRMHFVDEGKGEPVVFVHGNPTWSFEFRHLIKGLRSEFRCIAADLIGFGLSSRSGRSKDYHPKSHAIRFAALLNHLDLRNITLVMVDWGGPIGLEFARKYPERVRRLVIANTWCWPVSDDFHFKAFSFLMSSRIGQYLIRYRNIFVNMLIPMAVGDRSILTPEVMAHYRNAQPSPDARAAMAEFPRYIVGASDWLDSIWCERAAFVDKPALIAWGHRDIAFRKKELDRWKSELSDNEVLEFTDCGHYLAEEASEDMVSALRAFMNQA